VRALKAWIALRGKSPGPLFLRFKDNSGRLSDRGILGDSICERLKIALDAIGIDTKQYGSHSFRAGMVTAAIEIGASETAIILRTGHKSLDTMRDYVRVSKAFSSNPLAGVL
jgi:integrase